MKHIRVVDDAPIEKIYYQIGRNKTKKKMKTLSPKQTAKFLQREGMTIQD